MRFFLAVQPARATPDVAPFRARLAALLLDSAILAALLFAVISTLNVTSRSTMGDLFFGGGHRTVELRRETRVHADGTVRVWVVAEGEIRYDDGRIEPVRSELLVARNVRGLFRLVATQALIALLPFAYFAFFEGSRWQATPGKRAFGVRVVDLSGRRMGPGRAIARQFLKLFEIGATGFGYALAAITGTGQAFHDILVGTRVVRAGA